MTPTERLLSLERLANFAICPKLYYANYKFQLPKEAEILKNEILMLHKKEVIKNRVYNPTRVEADLRLEFSKLFDLPVKNEIVQRKVKESIAKFQVYNNPIFTSESLKTIEVNFTYSFMFDTETILAMAPVLMLNRDKHLVLIMFDQTIDSQSDFLRNIIARGHAVGFQDILPLSYIWNFNPVNGNFSQLYVNPQFIQKSVSTLKSLIRAIRTNTNYYGCRKCIMGNCS